jgi:hypothetical protein
MERNIKLIYLAGIIVATIVWSFNNFVGLLMGGVIMVVYLIHNFKKGTKKKNRLN